MVALGLVLLVVSGALALGVVLSNTDPITASAFGVTLADVNIGGFFLVGAATGLVFMLGLALMIAGAARRRSRRVQSKRAVKDVRTEKEQLAQENAELRERLADPYPGQNDGLEASTEGGTAASTTGTDRHAKRGLFGKS